MQSSISSFRVMDTVTVEAGVIGSETHSATIFVSGVVTLTVVESFDKAVKLSIESDAQKVAFDDSYEAVRANGYNPLQGTAASWVKMARIDPTCAKFAFEMEILAVKRNVMLRDEAEWNF